MRKLFLILLLIVLVVIQKANAQTPVAWYPLNGNANDISGNNLNGTIFGSLSFVNDRNGNANSAVSFDGNTANRIEIPDHPLLRPSSLTITSWVKLNNLDGIQTFVSKSLLPCINDSWHYGSFGSIFSTWASRTTSCGDFAQVTTAAQSNIWRFYAVTIDADADEMKLYINGVLQNTVPYTGVIPFDNNPVILGAAIENGSLSFPMNGVLDEVKIFNTVLTPAQIVSELGTFSPANFRTVNSGDWGNPATWEVFDGNSFVPAGTAPSPIDGIITVRSGHNVSINTGISVDQLVIESGATLNQNTDITIANGAGTDISVSGTYNWNAGLMNFPGNMVVESGGVLNLNSNVNYGVRASITNNGTFNWLEGNLKFSNNPVITNNAQMNIACNRVTQPDFSGGTFLNNGTITKTSTGITQLGGLDITNSGTFSAAGTIDMISGFTNTGILNLNAGDFNIGSSGVFTHNTGGTITGTGSINNFVVFTVNANLSFPAGITFNSASDFNLASAVTMTVTGSMNWYAANGGGAGANIILSSTAVLNFLSGSLKKVNGNITNNGTINWQDGQIRFSNNPVITNNGNLIIAGDNSTAPEFSGGSIVNNGTISKTSTGTTIFSGVDNFTNNSSGVIRGTGTISLAVGAYTNNGAIAPGNSPGILTIESADPLLPNGNLQIELLDGTGPGTGHDQLVRSSSLRLAGTLTVTETGSVPDGTYTIVNLNAGVITGYFDQIVKPAGYSVVVNSTNVQLIKGGPPVNPAQPGSGKAISFDGVNDVIQVPNVANDDFTYELWIKTSQVGANAGSQAFAGTGILSGDVGSATTGDFIPMALNGNLISFGTGDPDQTITAATPINDNKWHHVAVTRDKNTLIKKIYIDGVESASGSCSSLSYNLNPFIYIGADFVDNVFFEGQLDEIRVWNIPLTQSQIRDRMCRKITNSDALFANLVAYYNHDETVGIITYDRTGNTNDGSFINNPTRVTSGAAIGDASNHDYVNSTKTASIAHPSGESYTVTSTSGNPDGIHVYRVDEKPNTLAGAVGVGGNNKYFGVFQVNGTSPVYTAVYNYDGNPFVGTLNEAQVRLQKRNDNATMVWSPLSNTPDVVANTITVTGESTEYILGKQGDPLPLKLISFTGTKQNSNALLQWTTSNEVNLSHFEIQRSDNGQVFTTIGTLRAGGNTYSFPDINVFVSKANVFYRLKSVDTDGQFTYTNIIKLSQQLSGSLTIYPNPVKDVLSISGLKQNGSILLYGMDGKLLKQLNVSAQVMTIDMRVYAKGIYLLHYTAEGETRTQQIIKQ